MKMEFNSQAIKPHFDVKSCAPGLPLTVRLKAIALFTVTFSYLHDNVFERGCETISGNSEVFARNCLTSTLKYIVMQMSKGNCEKGYSQIASFFLKPVFTRPLNKKTEHAFVQRLVSIALFRYIKIHLKTIDITTRLKGLI